MKPSSLPWSGHYNEDIITEVLLKCDATKSNWKKPYSKVRSLYETAINDYLNADDTTLSKNARENIKQANESTANLALKMNAGYYLAMMRYPEKSRQYCTLTADQLLEQARDGDQLACLLYPVVVVTGGRLKKLI